MVNKIRQTVSDGSLFDARTVSLRDYISKEDEPDGKYRILRRLKTPFQRIAVVRQKDGQVLVYGDGYVMFGTTEDDDIWAETLVHIPMSVVPSPKRILIIGGGGGITTREVLRYTEVDKVTVIDIDDAMMDLGKNFKPLVKFNKGSLNDPKVRTIIKNGRAFVEKSRKQWDVIIIDVPEPSNKALALGKLYSREFYRLLKKRLAPGGVIAIASSILSEMPEFCWSVVATLKAAGYYVLPYHYDAMEKYEQDWCFCLAATRPISPNEVSMRINTCYLTPEKLREMFQIPLHYQRKWSERMIQTDGNDVLARIHEKH
ncbi:spermidine synthase [Brevibacillus choshinensis]|uniref:Polyamine aminopropyltransferase n=1 Tax=Brevibacillus choshinensis TaxID=54911 RepID=A0ABX7FS20_BRECH|nr:spermidine synthase [Brevibacillus choshinensis]QRG68047.1 spermidine synthase [Brevibacillus choshinensis]